MLFNLILENKGKAAASRTLDANTQRREITVTGRDRMRELDVSILITYWNVPRPNNTEDTSSSTHYYGEGNGIISSMNDSSETAIVTEYGFGILGQKTIWRGSAFYKTSPIGKLAFLNNTVGVFETDMDNLSLDVSEKVWERR